MLRFTDTVCRYGLIMRFGFIRMFCFMCPESWLDLVMQGAVLVADSDSTFMPSFQFRPYHGRTFSFFRSSHFGSPNYRKRCYIIGCRTDVVSNLDFSAMCAFIEHKTPSCHHRSSLMD